MAGVHADIGGGYKRSEKIFLVMDREVFYTHQAATARAAILQRARARGLCPGGVLPPGWVLKRVIRPSYTGVGPTSTVIYYLLRAKVTENGYATLPLRVMYNKAKKAGVPFIPLKDAKKPEQYAIPADLAQYEADPPRTLPPALWEKYAHVSAVDMQPVVAYRWPYTLGRYGETLTEQEGMGLEDDPETRCRIPN